MALPQNSQILTNDIITKETIAQYEGQAKISMLGDWKYSSMFGVSDNQVGDTIRIRRPVLTTIIEDDMNWVGKKPYETKVDFKVDKSFLVPLSFSDADLSLKIEDFSNRFIKEAVTQLTTRIDKYFYEIVINNSHWTVGQYNMPVVSDTIRNAKELLDASSMPGNDEVYGILTPKHTRSLAGNQAELFNSSKELSKIYVSGKIGVFHGITFVESNSSPTHIDGTVWAGAAGKITNLASPTVVLTSGWAETSTITVDGFTGSRTVKAGDVFSLSAAATGPVYNYNPWVGGRTPYIQQFVVREAVESTTATGQTLVISPALISASEYQNVDNLGTSAVLIPYSNSAATYGQEGLVFHKSAIAMASPKLTMPSGTDKMESASGVDTDINVRYSRDWMIASNTYACRLDVVVGCKVLRPEWICRVR